MLKQLLSLRYIQWRRNFSWKKFLAVLYLVVIMLMMIVSMLYVCRDLLADQLGKLPLGALAVAMISMMALPDFLLKMMWNTDAVVMDDFLRTKPVPSRVWNRFIAIVLAADPWNLVMPMFMVLMGALLLPAGITVLAVVATLVQTLMLSWLVADIHKAPDINHSLPLWIGAVVYYVGMTGLGIIMVTMMTGTGLYLPGSPWTELMLFIVLDIVLTGLLYLYFCRMRAYDEHEQHANTVRSVGDVTLFSTEYLSVWRSKRFRFPIILFTIVFLLQSYTMPDGTRVLIPVYFLLGWPSLFLGQWVFSIEGNYFHGLWTKPYSVEHVLLNKYKFFILLTLCMAVLLIPAIFFMGLRPTTLLALILFLGCGQSLLMMPTCLFSTRVDLFTSSFFNYQGANMSVTIYSFVIILVPLSIYALSTLLLPPLWGDALLAAIGVAALAVHRPCIRKLAQKWMDNRYENMERYLN